MKYNINEIQKILYSMVCQIIGICEENDVKYYLVKGGLIGAIRHKSFIPWDPDIDIAICATDLNHFCKVMRENLTEPYELNYFDKDNDYEYLFPRLGIKGIDYRKLHVDIFVLMQLPNNHNMYNQIFNKVNFWEKVNTIRNSKINRPINSLKNRLILIILKSLFIWIAPKYLRKKYLELICRNEDDDIDYLLVGAVSEYGKKYIMPINWFGKGIKVQFEGLMINCPLEYDKYLKQMYGDYTKVPDKKIIDYQMNRVFELPEIRWSELNEKTFK